MELKSKITIFIILYFVLISVVVIAGMFLVRFFMKIFNPGFYCNALVIDKEPEIRIISGVRGLHSNFCVYTVTLELEDSRQFRYIVALDTYVDLEVNSYYNFYIETNEIKEYEVVEGESNPTHFT